MSVEDKKLMEQYDITSESKITYSYKQYRYGNLKDAVNYARLDIESIPEKTLEIPVEK